MRMDAQSEAVFSQITSCPKFAAKMTKRLRAETDTTFGELAALRSAIRLLAEAARALTTNRDDARKYIVRAATLLRAESDLRERAPQCGVGIRGGLLAPWQATRVKRFIDANLNKKIGVQNFASVARLSPSYFARAFRATVGEAPHAYLIRRRIERVKALMLETDMPLAQIAVDCGLADQAHMTRLFSRVVGVSPGAWRRARGAPVDK